MPDAIGWKRRCHSVVVECKVSRTDFFADLNKPFRSNGEGLGCERYYMLPRGLISPDEVPDGWGLLACSGRKTEVLVRPPGRAHRTPAGLLNEMNLLLASLRRVEVRIEPQTITEFLKWKNRLAEYNGGVLPADLVPPECEANDYVAETAAESS
ncbi:MAG: hypothetical protein JO187_08875 [Acidobacteria bacterium]|nr:hypothetical protein [Acidobacteriota bacterium]